MQFIKYKLTDLHVYIIYIYVYECMFYVNFRRRVEFDLVESPLLELSDDDLLELVRQLHKIILMLVNQWLLGLSDQEGSEFQEHE